MVQLLAVEEGQVFDEDRGGPQDEGYEEVHVDVVPCAVELPARGGLSWVAAGARPPGPTAWSWAPREGRARAACGLQVQAPPPG